MKKLIVSIITICMLTVLFAGCGKSKPADNKNASGNSNEPKEISMTLMAGPKTTNTPVEKKLDEVLGVKFNFIMLPGWNDYKTKTNLLMSDPKTMPDILWWSGQDKEFQQWTNAGLIVDMLPLLKKYGREIIDYYGKDTLFFSYDNGHMYKIPSDVAEPSCMTTIIRQDWLEKLNLKVPTTIDEYINVLKAFVNDDPDGDGKADTYGISGPFEWRSFAPLIYPYKASPDDFVITSDGTIKHGSILPEMKTALEVLRQAYKDKLIDPNMLTQDDTAFQQEIANGKIGSFYRWIAYFNPGDATIAGFKAKNPDGKLMYIDPIKGPDGFSSDQPEDPSGWCYLSVTKHAQDPAACVTMLNKIMDPAINNIGRVGIEGVNYKMENGVYQRITDPEDDPANGIGLLSQVLNRKDQYNITNTPEVTALFQKHAQTSEPLRKMRVVFKDKARPEWTQYGADLNTLRDKTFLAIISGQADISAFDKYVEQWYAQGGKEVEQEANELYQKQKKDYEDFSKVYDTEIAGN